MKLIFFGTTSAVQTANNTNVSFAIVHKNEAVLIDASGSPFQSLLHAKINASELGALVLTHGHPDHLCALPSLIQSLSLVKRKKALKIICNQNTEKMAKQLLDIFDLSSESGVFPIEWIPAEIAAMECIPGVRLDTFPVNHSIPTSGVKLSTEASCLVYSSDTAPSERLVIESIGATTLIHESTGSDRHQSELNADGHSSALQAGIVAEKAGVYTLFLCHFNFELITSPESLKREASIAFGGKVIIPEPFQVYTI
jgi:ribonuclease Z